MVHRRPDLFPAPELVLYGGNNDPGAPDTRSGTSTGKMRQRRILGLLKMILNFLDFVLQGGDVGIMSDNEAFDV